MWRIFNKLFGWDYLSWTELRYSGISRIYKEDKPSSRVYFKDGRGVLKILDDPKDVIWLTCSSDKYFGGDDDKTEEPPDNK